MVRRKTHLTSRKNAQTKFNKRRALITRQKRLLQQVDAAGDEESGENIASQVVVSSSSVYNHDDPPSETDSAASLELPLFLGFDRVDIPINVLSLFDGISTGLKALDSLGVKVNKYYSSEIDPHAIAIQRKRFYGRITELGCAEKCNDEPFLDSISPIHLLIGGSPCNELSRVNPRRKLFKEGSSGKLVFLFKKVLDYLRRKSVHGNHQFHYLFENTSHLDQHIRDKMIKTFNAVPREIDSVVFIPMHRKRLFWDNLGAPQIDLESIDIPPLESYLDAGRNSILKTLPTVTTNSSNQKRNGVLFPVVDYDGNPDLLTVNELERLFGLGEGFTDNGKLSISNRRRLIGRSWVVPVISYLLSPLVQDE